MSHPLTILDNEAELGLGHRRDNRTSDILFLLGGTVLRSYQEFPPVSWSCECIFAVWKDGKDTKMNR